MICNWQQVCNRIGCKNCFSPEFLKSKDGQRSVKKSIIKLWNNFRIMFHIVKLWRLLTSHHLHGRSSKERIWRNLCVQVTRSKIMSVIFGPWAGSHCNTFGNCCLWINMCHPQMQVKAPSRKKKSCVNSESLLWAKVHLKWIEAKWETVLWSGLLSALNSKACIRDGLRGH